MLVALVDERRDRPAGHVVEPAAAQRKAWAAKSLTGGAKSMRPSNQGSPLSVGRCDIFQMTRLQRADMAGDDLSGELLIGRRVG